MAFTEVLNRERLESRRPCSCVQDISVTLWEENIMFWEVSGIGSEIIGLLWNLSFLEYSNGMFFLGLFISFIFTSLFFPTWSLLFLNLIPDCCFCL